MATLQTLNDGEAGGIVRGKINDNFTDLNSDISTLDTNKLEASDIATINGNTISAGGNLVIPVLTDGDKGDLTLSSSATVWTIDNNVVTNAKLGTTATNTIKGRVTAGTGNVEDLTPTQVVGMLPVATTSTVGTMSASDKMKLDGLSNEWTLVHSGTFTAGSSYNTSTLTSYDEYKVLIVGVTTGSCDLRMRFNSISSPFYNRMSQTTSGSQSTTTGGTDFPLFTYGGGSGYRFIGTYYVDRTGGCIVGDANVPFDATYISAFLKNGYIALSVTSIQLSTTSSIGGTIKIYGRNY